MRHDVVVGSPFRGNAMTRLALLLLLVVIAVILAACEGQRLSCDPANTPDCYQRQGRPLQNQ